MGVGIQNVTKKSEENGWTNIYAIIIKGIKETLYSCDLISQLVRISNHLHSSSSTSWIHQNI